MFGLVGTPKNEQAEIAPPNLIVVEPKDFFRAIYVAAASSDIERAERVMERLRAANMLVTSSWAANIRKVGAANPMDAPREQRYVWAQTCLHEVSVASTFLLLFPEKPTSGAWIELGYAECLQVMMQMGIEAGAVPPEAGRWIVGAGKEPASIFTALCDPYETDDAAIDAIVKATFSAQAAP